MCSLVNISVVNHSINVLGGFMYYTQRLQWIRDCRNISQKDLTEAIGLKQQQYARYEKGVNMMPVSYLIKICKYLDVSADYILGLTDEEKSYSTTTSVIK